MWTYINSIAFVSSNNETNSFYMYVYQNIFDSRTQIEHFLSLLRVHKRSRKKVWGIIFSCTVSRAVYIDLTEDYSTDSILQTLRRFVSIRGCPGEIQSDQGSQLVAAAKDIAQLVEKWDWKQNDPIFYE